MTWLMLVGFAMAAWPDSFPHRIAAMEALRYDLLTPSIPHNRKEVGARYKKACNLGYSAACKWEEWQGRDGGDAELVARFFAKGCKKNNAPLACVAVGMAYGVNNSEISVQAKKPKIAFSMFQKACKKKAYAPGCTYLGDMYKLGVSVNKNPKTAISLYEEACKAKDFLGCERLGNMYLQGDGVKTNPKTAQALFSKACSNGYVQSCVSYAELLYKRSDKRSDLRKAAGHFSVACKMGQMQPCMYLAQMHASGKGARRSIPVATALYKMTCARKLMAGCHGLAEMYLKGTDPNYEDAAVLFSQACASGYAISCSRYGKHILTRRGGDVRKALRLLQTGCKSGDIDGCLTIARVYHYGERVKPDLAKAKVLYKQGCQKKIGAACFELAQLSMSESAWKKTDLTPLYKKACSLGEGRGCGALAIQSIKKRGKTKRALSLLNKACKGKDAQSCEYLANMNMKRRPQTAWKYLIKACRYGGNNACMKVGKHYEQSKPSNIPLAVSLYEEACRRADKRGCKAAEPIAFRGRFSQDVMGAFGSSICQLWAMNPENDEDVLSIADVRGSQILPYVGSQKGKQINAILLREEFDFAVLHEGRSVWSVAASKAASEVKKQEVGLWGQPIKSKKTPKKKSKSNLIWGGSKSWAAQLIHTEQWDPRKGDIETSYPNDLSSLRGPNGQVAYSRESEYLQVKSSNCRFSVTQPKVQAEHCTPIQALLAGYVLMECS